MMQWLQEKTTWFWSKVAAVGFQSISTFYVFHESIAEMQMPEGVTVAGSLLAILLIDLLFIALINALEIELDTNELYIQRTPFAIGLLVLYCAILWIGWQSEGILSIAPRVGIGVLAFVAIMRWTFKVAQERDERWQTNFEKKRYREERADIKRLSKQQRKIKQQEQRKALQALRQELFNKYKNDHIKQLNLAAVVEEGEQTDKPSIPIRRISGDESVQQLPMLTEVSHTPIPNTNGHGKSNQIVQESTDPNIYQTTDGKWAYTCPDCGEVAVFNKLRGAQIRYGVHLNQCEHRVPVHHN